MSTKWYAIILVWIISFWSGFLHAEIKPFELKLPIMCGETNSLLQGIRDRYGEEMIFMSPSENEIGEILTHSLWVNLPNSTWSFIVVNKDKGVTCVISSGDNLQFFQPKTI